MGNKVGSRTLWKDLKLVVMPWIDSAISAITGVLSYSQPQTLTPTEQAQALSNMGVSGPPLTNVSVSSPLAGDGTVGNPITANSVLTSVAVTAPLSGDGTIGNPLTTPAQLWEISAGKLRYPLWPASLNLDVANGHVGINATSNTNWDTVGAGTWMLTVPKFMIKGPTMAESTFIGAVTISPANPVLELVTTFPFFGNSSYMGIEFEFIEANGKRAVVSASFVFGSLGNIASEEMSLNGNADPSAISVWIGTDAGVVKISMQDTLLGGNANVNIRVIHRTATVMESYGWTVTALPSPPAWTSNPTPNTQLITGNQAVNRFGGVFANSLTVMGSASVLGALAVVGPVTGASFTTPSDPMTKSESAEFGNWTGDLLDTLKFGTFSYNGKFGFTGHGAGVLDAGEFRDALPPALRDMYAPLVDYKDPDKKAAHDEKAAIRRAAHEAKLRDRQEKRAEKRKRQEEVWAKRLESASDTDAARLEIEQDDVALSMAESVEENNDQNEAIVLENEIANDLSSVPTVQIGMVNNSMLLGVALAEIKFLRKRVDKLEKKNK